MHKNHFLTFALLWGLLLPICSWSQEKTDLDQELEKFKNFFTVFPNKKAVEKDSTLYPSKLIMAPIIGYAPETDFSLGIGAKYLFKCKGSGAETRTSNMPITVQYTLNHQFILYSGFEIFTNQEKWVITGNFAFKNFPRLFYGFGRNTLEEDVEQLSFHQFRFEPIILKQMFLKSLFIGGGIRLNHIFDVDIKKGGILDKIKPPGYLGSNSNGIQAAIMYDGRDNILNASSGLYAMLTHGFYGKVLGGTQKFQLSRFDVRYFFKPFKKLDDVIGFQMMGRFSHQNTPFSELSLFGGEEILRGYIEGRYMDRHIMATQMEYRKNIYGRIGMVAFGGVGDTTNKLNQFKLNHLRPTVGLGLRFLLDKEEKLNARLDWGFGEKTDNLYLNIAESF